jgi:hypothetical protein
VPLTHTLFADAGDDFFPGSEKLLAVVFMATSIDIGSRITFVASLEPASYNMLYELWRLDCEFGAAYGQPELLAQIDRSKFPWFEPLKAPKPNLYAQPTEPWTAIGFQEQRYLMRLDYQRLTRFPDKEQAQLRQLKATLRKVQKHGLAKWSAKMDKRLEKQRRLNDGEAISADETDENANEELSNDEVEAQLLRDTQYLAAYILEPEAIVAKRSHEAALKAPTPPAEEKSSTSES